VRIRLGPVSRRDVEGVLVDGGYVEAPAAARLARLAAGRPGEAVALARAPEAVTIRSEVGRTLLDLIVATRTDRLRIARDLLARAAALASSVAAAASSAGGDGPGTVQTGRARSGRGRSRSPAASDRSISSGSEDAGTPDVAAGSEARGPAAKVPAAERRAAALGLVAIWRDVARDLALVALGQRAEVRQLDLLDDLESAAGRLDPAFAVEQLRRLELAGERLEGNVSPELVIDALVLGWAA
jgi:hypothetical protein